MRPKQIGSVAAVVTLAAAVALIVVLLHSAAPGARTGSSAGTPQTVPTATPTTVSAPKGEWVPIAGVANVTGQIMIAPSNPDVIYEDLTPMGGAATLTLRRSDDGGKTWHQLAQPTEQSLSFDESAILVSPLDPNTVFETLTFYTIPHPGFCQSSGLGGGYARLSGGPSCEVQFYSSNGGQSWSRLSLPVAGALGAPYSAGFDFPNSLEVLRPQGQRLYSAVSSNSTVNNVTFGGPNVRILASDDGGKTWQLVDSAIQASGQNACDFTPTSTGGTIFAITQTSDCYTQKNATTFLWRSDDGGAHWRQVGTLPGPATSMVLGSQGTGADPLIYADTSPYPQPGAVDSQIIVSQDGGKTWQDAPSAGFPDNPASDQGIGTAGPLTALSDGSVVKGFASQNNTVAFFAWKIGEKAWHQVTPSLQSTPAVQGMSYLQSCLIIVGADGKATFWAVAEETNGNSLFGYDQQ